MPSQCTPSNPTNHFSSSYSTVLYCSIRSPLCSPPLHGTAGRPTSGQWPAGGQCPHARAERTGPAFSPPALLRSVAPTAKPSSQSRPAAGFYVFIRLRRPVREQPRAGGERHEQGAGAAAAVHRHPLLLRLPLPVQRRRRRHRRAPRRQEAPRERVRARGGRKRRRAREACGEGRVSGGAAPPRVQEPVPDLRGVRHRRGRRRGGAGDGDRAPYGREARGAHRVGRQHQHHHQPPLLEPCRTAARARLGRRVHLLCRRAAAAGGGGDSDNPAGALHASVRARHGRASRWRGRHGGRSPASQLGQRELVVELVRTHTAGRSPFKIHHHTQTVTSRRPFLPSGSRPHVVVRGRVQCPPRAAPPPPLRTPIRPGRRSWCIPTCLVCFCFGPLQLRPAVVRCTCVAKFFPGVISLVGLLLVALRSFFCPADNTPY